MQSDNFILKAQINNKTVYLKLQWKQDDIDLFHLQMISDDGKSWSGAFSNDLALTFMENLFQSKDIYSANTKTCLTGEGGDEYKLDVCLNNEDFAEFCWKKRYQGFFQEQGKMKLNLDKVPVSKDTLIDFLIDENKNLRVMLATMYRQAEEMNEVLERSRNELDRFVDIKETVEATLYGKFALLLNTKKQRIQFLEEQLLKHETDS